MDPTLPLLFPRTQLFAHWGHLPTPQNSRPAPAPHLAGPLGLGRLQLPAHSCKLERQRQGLQEEQGQEEPVSGRREKAGSDPDSKPRATGRFSDCTRGPAV